MDPIHKKTHLAVNLNPNLSNIVFQQSRQLFGTLSKFSGQRLDFLQLGLPLIGRQGDDRPEFAEICLPGKSLNGVHKNLFVRKTIGEICLPDNFLLEEYSSADDA